MESTNLVLDRNSLPDDLLQAKASSVMLHPEREGLSKQVSSHTVRLRILLGLVSVLCHKSLAYWFVSAVSTFAAPIAVHGLKDRD